MSDFLNLVIAQLNTDNYHRDIDMPYCSFSYAMDNEANMRSCAVNAGWTVREGAFGLPVLERGHNVVPLTWREKFRLTKAFDAAMSRKKRDRKAYLAGLRN